MRLLSERLNAGLSRVFVGYLQSRRIGSLRFSRLLGIFNFVEVVVLYLPVQKQVFLYLLSKVVMYPTMRPHEHLLGPLLCHDGAIREEFT